MGSLVLPMDKRKVGTVRKPPLTIGKRVYVFGVIMDKV